MACAECACGAFAVAVYFCGFAVDFVGFDFCDVVGDVVDEVEVEVFGVGVEDVLECLSGPVGDHLSVCPGVVAGGCHGGVVVLGFGAGAGGAGEFAVGDLDFVFVGGVFHDA